MKVLSKSYIIFLFCGLGVSSCADKWEDHIGDVDSQKNLYEVVQENTQFSAFAGLLEQSGYADDLKASKNYTLIIPTNEAIDAVKANYNFSDTAVLRSFVGYHIINSIYNVNETTDTVRAQNFRGKYVEFTRGAFDEVVPTSRNVTAGNGIYHVVPTALKPLQSVFAFVMTNFPDLEQMKGVLSFDTVYNEGGRITIHNNGVWYTQVRRHMTREDRKITYFVVDDEYYNAEYDKLRPYHYTSYAEDGDRPDSTTTFFTKRNLLRDFIVEGELDGQDLQQDLLSVAGTKFRVDAADIISTHKTSNGRVYRVRKLDVALADRIKELKVFGNQPIGFRQNDKGNNIYYRNKRDLNGELYDDIEIHGHGVTAFYAKYRLNDAAVVRYKVYARAIMGLTGDPQTTTFTQLVQFLDPTLTAANEVDLYKRPVVNNFLDANDTRMIFVVTPRNHDEVYLGEVTQDEFGRLPLLVMSTGTGTPPATGVIANGSGPIILEYLRFVPILP